MKKSDMIGKTLYKSKIENDNIKIFSQKIVKERGGKYYFANKLYNTKSCYSTDVGVVCFLTIKEAVDYQIKELEHFVELGEQYHKKMKLQLSNAKQFQTSKK